jgi:hypothetical protein
MLPSTPVGPLDEVSGNEETSRLSPIPGRLLKNHSISVIAPLTR